MVGTLRFAHPTDCASPKRGVSSSGLTGRSSTPRPFDLFAIASGILDHPLEPVIGLAEDETRWQVMTTGAQHHATVWMMPPSARRAAPLVAEASFEVT